MDDKLVIGLDFGTDSVRALVVKTADGEEVASQVSYYKRWKKGQYCDPVRNQFRQHPLDYLEGLEEAIKGALQKCPDECRKNIVGIGVDTTGSTPCAVDQNGTPLALLNEFRDNPNGMFILWKDHTAIKEAEEINNTAKSWNGVDYTKYEGGVYSSEWFWAKIIHTIRENIQIREAAYSWVEHCDWIPAVLTGNTVPRSIKRSRCAAGHKAMWHEEWGGLPPEGFLTSIEPQLEGVKERLYSDTYTSDVKAGELSIEWANRLGLTPGIAVTVGAFDAHMGAVGGGITENTIVKIMGTSTCDVMVASSEVINKRTIKGICGQVNGSVIPGLVGLEAGQSAFGDVYAWFKNLLSWPLKSIVPGIKGIDEETKELITKELEEQILINLSKEAAEISLEETGLIALDWLNGRRTPFADQTLKGAILGLNLGTTAPGIFRALVEATAFGARAINEQFIKEGVAINQVIALGGITQKNDFVMQITADVLNKPLKVVSSDQACALGAAMFAATAAGIYQDINKAQNKMNSGFSKVYYPDSGQAEKYQKLYETYISLGNDLEDYLKKL